MCRSLYDAVKKITTQFVDEAVGFSIGNGTCEVLVLSVQKLLATLNMEIGKSGVVCP